jgi:hypothetical protein
MVDRRTERVVDFEDLFKFRRELKSVGEGLEKELQKTNKRVVENIVVPVAKRKAAETRTNIAGGTARLGSRGVGTVRALATQTRAQIAGGGAKVPWFMGSQFGSAGEHRQFPRAKPGGYIIYPAIAETRDEFREEYADAVEKLAKRAFPG